MCGSLEENGPQKGAVFYQVHDLVGQSVSLRGWALRSLLLNLPSVCLSVDFLLPLRCITLCSSTTSACKPPGALS